MEVNQLAVRCLLREATFWLRSFAGCVMATCLFRLHSTLQTSGRSRETMSLSLIIDEVIYTQLGRSITCLRYIYKVLENNVLGICEVSNLWIR